MKKKISEICQVLNGRAYKQEELLDSGKYRVLRVGNFFTSDRWYFSNLELDDNKYCDNGDLLFAWSATFGPRIWEGEKVIFHYHIWKMIPKTDLVDKWFLYYWLKKNVSNITAGVHGSVMAHITKGEMENFEIELPTLEEQKKISGLLRSIDEKIKNNTKINDNLLQQALCIYSYMIGSSNKDGCIGDYCNIKSGFAFKSKWWQDSGIPVIKIGSINQDSLNLSDCSFVSEDKIAFANDFIVGGGDLLIAMTGATIGKFAMVPKVSEIILVNQRVGKFFLGDNPINRLPFIYCTLKQPEIISEVINRGQGSAQPNISASDIMSIPCVIPTAEEIDKFNESTSQMFELIINNQYENAVLANTRDTLLPKLMSGEIDVSDIDI